MKYKHMYSFSLAFVFLLVGITCMIPALGEAYQIGYEVWYTGNRIGINYTANSNPMKATSGLKVVRAHLSYEVMSGVYFTLWSEEEIILIKLTGANTLSVTNGQFNITFSVNNPHMNNAFYVYSFVFTIAEPGPTIWSWFILSGVCACLPLLVDFMRDVVKKWREFWNQPDPVSQNNTGKKM